MTARPRTLSKAVCDILTSRAAYEGRRVTITDRIEDAVWQEIKRTLRTLKAKYLPGSSSRICAQVDGSLDAIGDICVSTTALTTGVAQPRTMTSSSV